MNAGKIIATRNAVLDVQSVAPAAGSVTQFDPMVRLVSDSGPFSLAVELSPAEAMRLAEALSSHAIRADHAAQSPEAGK